MDFDHRCWQRLEWQDMPFYLRGEQPAWFVPNAAGDRVLRHLQQGGALLADPLERRFLARLPGGTVAAYPGRAALLNTTALREIWFHVTNRCNMTCRHCMFRSGPRAGLELPTQRVLELARQASALGCRVFALTGGEPLVHHGFDEIARGVLNLDDSRLVILTNGLLLRRRLARLRCDRERLHLQVSVDGLRQRHDRLRGAGAFERLTAQLRWLRDEQRPFTVSMCVTADNVADMPGVVDFTAAMGGGNVHFMWYFVHGRGAAAGFVEPARIFEHLLRAVQAAQRHGIAIDNLEALKTQVFAPSGTRHDGANHGWESLAVGPDGRLYPSAALVGVDELASEIGADLAAAWRGSPLLERLRRVTAASLRTPWRFLLGGGDPDHSYLHGGRFIGCDPYQPLYERLALWLVRREAKRQPEDGPPRLRLKMGDILESCGAHGAVALLHGNCLLALAGRDSHTVVKDYYRAAASETREEILNPVAYDKALIAHIPEDFRFRGYGCGSPVLDARLQAGEAVVDLGCGRGVECFIAARLVGARGRVVGIDMLKPMLAVARRGAQAVAGRLGFANLTFHQGYLEQLPLESATMDAVLSNCVMNLSPYKRRAFAEILRVLRPGGRLVIADVVCEREPDAAIRNDETLRGECIAGALTQRDLIGILEECGFGAIRLIKRFPYRTVAGHPFFSLTYEAVKPAASQPVRVLARGPLTALGPDGEPLAPGATAVLPSWQADLSGEQLFQLDAQGAVTNLDLGEGCACALPPEADSPSAPSAERFRAGCMVCGSELRYLEREEQRRCHFCEQTFATQAVCAQGHYVCDACHARDARQVIETICLASDETDMLRLLDRITAHPAFPANGPDYHALVPAVILTTFRNLGGHLPPEAILTGIRRGAQVAGGSCAFWGVCGAAAGVGIAFSLLLEANPMKARERQTVQQAVQQVLADIAALRAARCCRRDSFLALRRAARLSRSLLPVTLCAEAEPGCRQWQSNAGCLGDRCPLGARRVGWKP